MPLIFSIPHAENPHFPPFEDKLDILSFFEMLIETTNCILTFSHGVYHIGYSTVLDLPDRLVVCMDSKNLNSQEVIAHSRLDDIF